MSRGLCSACDLRCSVRISHTELCEATAHRCGGALRRAQWRLRRLRIALQRRLPHSFNRLALRSPLDLAEAQIAEVSQNHVGGGLGSSHVASGR